VAVDRGPIVLRPVAPRSCSALAAPKGGALGANTVRRRLSLSLLKTVNYRGSLAIFLCDRRTLIRYDRHSIRFRVLALVPVSQPSIAGARACRAAT
jgi:hypothetical protein